MTSKTIKKIPFDQWFEEHYGKRPSDRALWQLAEEIRRLSEKIEAIKRLLEDCRTWDLQLAAARDGNTASVYVLKPGVIAEE